MSSRARLAASRCIFSVGQLAHWMKSLFHHMGNYPDAVRFWFFVQMQRNSPRTRGPTDARKFLVDRPLWFRGCTKRRRAPTLRPLKQRKNASRLLVHRRSHPKWLPRPPRSPPSSSTAPSPVRTAPFPVHRVSRVFRVSRTHRDPTDPETRPEERPRASSASVSVHTASVNTSVSCLPSSRSRTSRRARPGRRFRVGDRVVRFSQQPSRGFLHLLSVD